MSGERVGSGIIRCDGGEDPDHYDSGRKRCVACGEPRDEWPEDRVLLGELTRRDVNVGREREGLGPICGSHECKLEQSGELINMYGTIRKAARFGGPGWRKL